MPGHNIKLWPLPGFRLPSLQGVSSDLSPGNEELIDLFSTYWDTPDLRLSRSGASLRFSEPEGWTVNLPGPNDYRLLARPKIHFIGDPGEPPFAAIDLVRAWVRTSKVQVVAQLKTRRRSVTLRTRDGKNAAEIVDDEVTVLDAGRIVTMFREVKVKPGDDLSPITADLIVGRLRAAGAGSTSNVSTVVRALGARASAPPDVVVPTPPGRTSTTREAIQAAISSSVARLIDHDAGARLGDDPEMVHQARVATRRLRSDLRTFRPLLDEQWDESLRGELRWLGSELGKVRDAEVLIDLLRTKAARLSPQERVGFEPLLRHLIADWQAARIELLAALRTNRYALLLDSLVAAAREPALVPEADAPAIEVLPPLVRLPWKRLRRDVKALAAVPPDGELHAVRIRAKRMRYASEAVAAVFGAPAVDLAKTAGDLQKVLGDHQDAAIALIWLRVAAKDARTSDEAFLAGMVAGMVREDERSARAAWPRTWKALNRTKLRTWL